MITDAYRLNYDTEASGPFTEGEQLTFLGGAIGELIILRDDGLVGSMYYNLLSGTPPADNETITGGTSAATAAVNGTPFLSRFPLYIRDDTSKNAGGDVRWTGPSLGTTHSCKYDGEAAGPFIVGDVLNFAGGATGTLVQLTDAGLTGVLYFRLIGTVIPLDNEAITTPGGSGATAVVNGVISERCYTPQEMHYWFSDLGDDSTFIGDDVQDRTRERVSNRIFTTIVTALGTTNIDDAMSYHMYGGSWAQTAGAVQYSGLDISIVDPLGTTEPIVIQNNALLSTTTTEYWKNSYMASAAAKIRLMVKTRTGDADIDRKVVRVRALERFDSYFTAPDVTLGTGVGSASLVSNNDGSDTTADATVATWIDVALTSGYQLVDHNNANGAQPYWLTIDRASRTKTQTHERGKWIQRRGTTETLHGLNYQLIVGNDLDVPYDTEALGPWTEGETVTFSGGCTALLLALDDNGVDGVLYLQRLTGDAPVAGETMSGGTSTTTAAVASTPTTRLITNNLIGVYTGSAFNPANRGVTLDAADADTNDLFTDLLGILQSPPNNQQGIINTAIGNIITLYPYDGVATDSAGDPEPDYNFRALSVLLSLAAETQAVISVAIPSWVPTSGFLRITTNTGNRRLVAYNSWVGSTFTFTASEDFTGDNASIANALMPAPIDQQALGTATSFTGVYSADQEFVFKVQLGSAITPKKPGIGTTTFGSGGFSVNVILGNDD